MYRILFFILAFGLGSLPAQEINRVIMDTNIHRQVLQGICTREAFEREVFLNWFNEGYQNYHPDPAIIQEIRNKNFIPEIIVILATWCGDTKRNLPAFLKIVDLAGIPQENIFMVAIDRKWSAGDIDISNYRVERVPTFIIFKEGKELGRIVEKPVETLEKDFLAILKMN